MEQQEITLGQATYQVSRVYAGTRPASELVAERLAKQISENPPFDEGHTKVVEWPCGHVSDTHLRAHQTDS